ncbi:MAG: anti-sigma factor [Pseudolabrys sp.]|nr:anti-sigma factor [Pseudolabrys sp.]MDP2297427.1 anti-sigma factor [Pseudolabrys sp.]
MIDRETPVTEEELHAYVDGELPADRREAVGAWLAANPEQAALVAAWRAQADSIRARYGDVVNEPVPERLHLDQIIRNDITHSRTRGRTWAAMATAAALVAFIAGGGVGWYARAVTTTAPAVFDRFTAEALDAYKLYVVEVRHPVEVPGSEVAHLRQWLSRRVGHELNIPDLQSLGLKLVGGRLLPGPTGAAAFYMYEGPTGERFTIYCGKAGGPETALHFKSAEPFASFTWVDDKVGYVVSGPADRARLEAVTKVVYEQVDKTAEKKG